MWVTWLLLVLLSACLMILQASLLIRDKLFNPTPKRQPEWSPSQDKFLKGLQLFGWIGAVIIWSALVYVLIEVGGWHWMQPTHKGPHAWALAYLLIYTSFVMSLMRASIRVTYSYWRPTAQLRFQAFFIIGFFVISLASIADLYFPPPMGSRPTGALSPPFRAAFDNAVALVGCPDRWIDRLCITCCSPFQPSHKAG
jgi:hypothetical protein